jgi:hypothetical protein
MKCIKLIKPIKQNELGEILRIEDKEAESKVSTGYWQYVSKSEWKNKINENAEQLKPKIDSELKTMGVSEKNRKLVQSEIDGMKKVKSKKIKK